LEVCKCDGSFVVRLRRYPRLDDATVRAIDAELYGVADRTDCRNLLLNLAGVAALSSMMLGKLVSLQRKMRVKGGSFVLCEVGAEIEPLFVITRLDQIMDIKSSEAEGLAAFQRGPAAVDPLQLLSGPAASRNCQDVP
jgi:anti-anti-sigma factor